MARRALFAPNFGRGFGDPDGLVALATAAERAGWDGLFLWDHVVPGPGLATADPWVALAAIAAATERLVIGPMVTPLPRRRPWQVARACVSLDRMSGGRLVLGVGIGSGRTTEWDQLGEQTDPRVRGAMLDEGLAVLDPLLRGEAVDHAGTHYRVRAEPFEPPSIQRPRIPVWVAGYWPNRKPLRRAARFEGVFPLLDSPDELRGALAVVDEARDAEHARAGAHDVLVTLVPEPGRPAGRLDPWREAGATWIGETLVPEHFGGGWGRAWPEAAIRDYVDAGPVG